MSVLEISMCSISLVILSAPSAVNHILDSSVTTYRAPFLCGQSMKAHTHTPFHSQQLCMRPFSCHGLRHVWYLPAFLMMLSVHQGSPR